MNVITKDRIELITEAVRRATNRRIELTSHSEDDSIKMRGKLPLIYDINFASCGSMTTSEARSFANQLMNATFLADHLTKLHFVSKWEDDEALKTSEDFEKAGAELTQEFIDGDWLKLLRFAVDGLKEA